MLNQGENVCFFNCVVQALYAISAFRDFIQVLTTSTQAVRAIKEMFEQISISNEPIKTSKYIQRLNLSDYVFHQQYDAHECLIQFLDRIYPTITDNCMFKISILESTQCSSQENNCDHCIEKSIEGTDFITN